MMEHPGQPWGKLEIPTCPVTACGTVPTRPLSFLQRWLLLLQTPHPHACFIPFYTTSLTGLHIWIFLTSALIQTAQGWFCIRRPARMCRVWGLRREELIGHWTAAVPNRCGCWCGKRKWTRLSSGGLVYRSKNWKKWQIAFPSADRNVTSTLMIDCNIDASFPAFMTVMHVLALGLVLS